MRRISCAAFALTLSACTVTPRAPTPGDLALRRPANRDGMLISGELVRLTWLNGPGGPTPYLVASRVQPGGRLLYTFTGFLANYRDGLLVGQSSAQAELSRARARSTFHQPVSTRFGKWEAWVIHDVVPRGQGTDGKHLLTLELYASDPRLAPRGSRLTPQLLVIGEQDRDGRRLLRSSEEVGVIQWHGVYAVLDSVSVGEDGRLTAATFNPWRPAISKVLAGATSRDFQTNGAAQMVLEQERVINETLVEWKTKEMPGWIARMTASEFADAVVLAEKGMLELDVRSRVLKDEIDAAARSGGGADPARTEMAQLIDQRKTLLAVVINSVKSAWSRAATAPVR